MRLLLVSLFTFLSSVENFSIAAELPRFHSGDVIFQTSSSRQSYAIMWASKSLYSHVGIIEEDGGKFYVIEAISKVSRTPLEKWITRKLFKGRWQNHPLCKGKVNAFDLCWEKVLNDELITSASLAKDQKMQTVFSNYP